MPTTFVCRLISAFKRSSGFVDHSFDFYVEDSAALIPVNQIRETSGIADRVEIYGVGCDEFCGLTKDVDGSRTTYCGAEPER